MTASESSRPVGCDLAALEACRLRAAALERRFGADDIDAVAVAGAHAYLSTYDGDFAFLVDLRRRVTRGLSAAQVVAVLNCLRAEVRRGERPRVELGAVPAGCYAVDNLGGGVSFFRVLRPSAGPRAGWAVVEQFAGDELLPRGHQRPGAGYRGLLADLVAAIAADPEAAAARYGRERRTCGLCGHQLTTPDSRARGFGPVCAARVHAAVAGAG